MKFWQEEAEDRQIVAHLSTCMYMYIYMYVYILYYIIYICVYICVYNIDSEQRQPVDFVESNYEQFWLWKCRWHAFLC